MSRDDVSSSVFHTGTGPAAIDRWTVVRHTLLMLLVYKSTHCIIDCCCAMPFLTAPHASYSVLQTVAFCMYDSQMLAIPVPCRHLDRQDFLTKHAQASACQLTDHPAQIHDS